MASTSPAVRETSRGFSLGAGAAFASGAVAELVERAAATRSWELVWDLGCNEGRHARIAAETAEYVVAVEGQVPQPIPWQDPDVRWKPRVDL